jgi:hypothetical protein
LSNNTGLWEHQFSWNYLSFVFCVIYLLLFTSVFGKLNWEMPEDQEY